MYSKQVFVIWIDISLFIDLLKLEITVSCLWLSVPVYSESLKRAVLCKIYGKKIAILNSIETYFLKYSSSN